MYICTYFLQWVRYEVGATRIHYPDRWQMGVGNTPPKRVWRDHNTYATYANLYDLNEGSVQTTTLIHLEL